MKSFTRIAAILCAAGMSVAGPALAQTAADDNRFEAAQRRFADELSRYQAEFDRYQSARAERPAYRDQGYRDDRYSADDRYEEGYDPARHYRSGDNYRERVLAQDDRVYRGSDGRYYCRRSDGTTGLIIGAAGGGILGNVIDGGRSRTVGTLLGAAVGALAGRAVDQNQQQIRCR